VRRYQPEAAPKEEPVVVEETPAQSRRLVISLSQTQDKEGDVASLHKLIVALRDFPGEDEVNLCVTNGDKIINLKMSNIYVDYCPELHQRLVALVGEGGLRVEQNG
jgi:DNA polymerase-3 subunit alpha